MQLRAIVEAQPGQPAARRREAYRREVGRGIAAELAPHALRDDRRTTSREPRRAPRLIGEALVLGNVRDVLQPTVDKSGSLSLRPRARRRRRASTRWPPRCRSSRRWSTRYGAYLAAHKVEKPDIWAARDVELPPGAV